MSNKLRKIVHIDMDSFFAAIEVREDSALKGKPIAVGGQANKRGVVATCSYEARKFGVHSAMAMSRAVKICPELIVLPVRMALYKQVSVSIQSIFREITDLVEPLSLDEAFLDVSDVDCCQGSATLIAAEICQRIFDKEQLTASAGIASNKFLAKIASDWRKPNGQFVITPDKIDDFVLELPVSKIFGVGKVTEKKMAGMNILSCGDLQQYSVETLSKHFGSFGARLYELSRGIDHREVQTHRIRKSLSVEETYPHDLPSLEACLLEIPSLFTELIERLQRARKSQVLLQKNAFVKLRFDDFETTTVQMSTTALDKRAFYGLCAKAWERGARPVRLIGIGVRFYPPDMPVQMALEL
ncbi:MAG TPA: DNA polymerase IV [Leucothrix mucor]|nr:DNA polymerase IV [Leucothrix mucor]